MSERNGKRKTERECLKSQSSEKPCEFYARLLAKSDEQKRAQNIVKSQRKRILILNIHSV